jgi:guanylate cyclase
MRMIVNRWFNRLLGVGAAPADPPALRQRKRLFVGALWGMTAGNSLFLLLVIAQGVAPLVTLLVSTIVIFLGLLASLHWRPALFRRCVHLLGGLSLLSIFAATLLFGGPIIGGFALIPGILIPLMALIMLGPRAGTYWLGAFLGTVMAGALGSRWVPAHAVVVLPHRSAIVVQVWIFVGCVLFLSMLYFIRQRDDFQRKSDHLLRNILPDAIAERLKDSSTFIADHFDAASVLFADVVGFTPLSATMSPTALVTLLNEVFGAFDTLVAAHDMEKIKTIGDCYMVAAGVPHPRPDHAHALTHLALAMQALVASRPFDGHTVLFRIGLNSGPVVAGVIGHRKVSYDLWGDTVNTASRMESHGAGGCIQITEATYALIRDDFMCAPQAPIHVKGKGAMPVWYVLGVHPQGNPPIHESP